jgi:uncharacterized repeat protein (TIGR03803 family)
VTSLISSPGRLIAVLILCCFALAITAPAQTFTNLGDLDGSDGAFPQQNALIQGTDGNFYGTTLNGGAFGHGTTFGQGTVYKVTADGTVSALYVFCSLAQCADGAQPTSSLVLGGDGNFYGATTGGGANNSGTFFKLTPDGTLTTLYSFCSQTNCADGDGPSGAMVMGFDGNFYGATAGNIAANRGAGTIFKITPSGVLTTLHTFCSVTNCADGVNVRAGLVRARDGSFYGTTLEGGTTGLGTIFRFTPTGQFKTLYTFCSEANCADGESPYGPLAVGANGNVYGTVSGGGSGGLFHAGTAFQLAPDGTYTVLYNFCTVSTCLDGAVPWGGLVLATDGRLYGTTVEGGFNDRGIVFRMTSGGVLTRLHSFDATDGAAPLSAVVEGTDGNIYGTTTNGGPRNKALCANGGPPFGCGTTFRLSLGLKPFVKTVQPAGKVADSILILGNGLTGSTNVTFNGTAATFTVVSDTEITATVPAGATTGSIQVVTPSTTLSSNSAFHILP